MIKISKHLLALMAILLCPAMLSAETGKGKQIVDYVNPMVGASTSTKAGRSAHGLGKTFPGTATPFGLVQLSPDTKTGGDNGPGY